MKTKDLIASIIVMAMAGFFYYKTFSFPSLAMQETGPAFIPRIYCVALMLLGVILFISALRRAKDTSKKNHEATNRVLIMIGLMILYVFLIPNVGFYLTTLCLVFLFLWLSKIRKKVVLIATPIGAIVFVYLVFHVFLSVQLPRGLFL